MNEWLTIGTKHNKLNLLDETIDPHIVDGVLAIVVDALGGLRRRRRRRAALSELVGVPCVTHVAVAS